MSKIICPPQSGRVGNVVYINSKRYGQLVRAYTPPRNPRTERQQVGRQAFGSISSQWRDLPLESQLAWAIAAEQARTNLSGYHYYMKLKGSGTGAGRAQAKTPGRSWNAGHHDHAALRCQEEVAA